MQTHEEEVLDVDEYSLEVSEEAGPITGHRVQDKTVVLVFVSSLFIA